MNRNIDEQYRQMLIQVKTTEMANGDLDKYHHALDKYVRRSALVGRMELTVSGL